MRWKKGASKAYGIEEALTTHFLPATMVAATTCSTLTVRAFAAVSLLEALLLMLWYDCISRMDSRSTCSGSPDSVL